MREERVRDTGCLVLLAGLWVVCLWEMQTVSVTGLGELCGLGV